MMIHLARRRFSNELASKRAGALLPTQSYTYPSVADSEGLHRAILALDRRQSRNAKTKRPVFETGLLVFLYPPPAGAGHCAHLRSLVAGAGLEPASRGYEPRELPLLYPAIGHTIRAQGGIASASLQRTKLAECGLVARKRARNHRGREVEGRALVRALVTHFVSLPRVVQGA